MHVSTKNSPHARWHALPLDAVQLTDGFWYGKQIVNRQASLQHGYQMLEKAGNFHDMKLAAGLAEGEDRGMRFRDSDLYKWLEAVAYELVRDHRPELDAWVQETVDLLQAAQEQNGYLNSHFQVAAPEKRWADIDHGHELYCAGHLFEAAVALHRATGDSRLLQIARRFADLIDDLFGPGKHEAAPGHPEIELALIELYRETGERRYLDLTAFFVDQRGKGVMRGLGRHNGPEYHQDHVPVREATAVIGHAVRQLYLTTGMTDLYLETGEEALLDALALLWDDMTMHKMHVTGGLGARYTGESFGEAYELPSDRCYCETCAAIANVIWNWRMLLATGDARYADLLERSLYNGFLSGVSLDGRHFFYVNPLMSRGSIERQEWYECACCPPNVMRLMALIGHHVATVDRSGLQIHQYAAAKIDTELKTGRRVALGMETEYPWQGHVKLSLEASDGSPWKLTLRVPEWCEGASLQVNGQHIDGALTGGTYVSVERAWQVGDVIDLNLPLVPRLTEPNPRADAIRNSLCIERGPLVYCLEAEDQDPDLNMLDVRIAPDAALEAVWQADLLDGVVAISAPGTVVEMDDWQGALYRPAAPANLAKRDVTLTAVPYYAWANRDPGAMRVWIPRADG